MIQKKVQRKIMWGDLDALYIVFYPKYYEWIDGSTHLFFEKIRLNLVELSKKRQLIFSLVKTSCEYLSPGRYLQDIIITTQIEKLGKKTITMKHTIADRISNKVLVQGFEKRICMDVKNLENLRAIDIPEDIYKILKTSL